MDEALRRQPLPKTLAEHKNQPLYALQRHLLQFEAIYPRNPDPVGFFRGEAVYEQSCMHTLHSRAIWLKDAQTVKVDEETYNIVKKPKLDRLLRKIITEKPLEVFGSWEVEDYQTPVATSRGCTGLHLIL